MDNFVWLTCDIDANFHTHKLHFKQQQQHLFTGSKNSYNSHKNWLQRNKALIFKLTSVLEIKKKKKHGWKYA